MRNPWGAERYAARWSDGSDEWTPERIEEVNNTPYGPVIDNNEGLFFIDIDSFMNNFSQVTINKATADWSQGWFLKLDDQTPADSSGYIYHELRVTNTHTES